jgi:mannose-6-phosphate isomerase-like protein (cupin superfamily)
MMSSMAAKTVRKPWGREIVFARNRSYAGKILVIEKGHRLSLQYHKVKRETLYLLEGRLHVELGHRLRVVKPGAVIDVPPGTVHRFHARTGRVTLVEVSTPELSDIVRLADDYGR